MKRLFIHNLPRPAAVVTPPFAHPVAWSSNPRSTWSTGVRPETRARTVLVLPGSSTLRPGQPAASGWGHTGADDHCRQPHARPQPHGQARGRDDGVGDRTGGCYPLALLTPQPSLSFLFSSMARKGNKEGGGS